MTKNAHTQMILYLCPDFKKDRPTDPPNFHAKRANKPFIFSGLIVMVTPSHM